MNKSTKAALLSALVYPGIGHFFLKKYTVCVLFVTTFSVPLYFIIHEITAKAERIIEQIKNGEIPLDIAAISAALSSSTTGTDAQELNLKMYVLIFIWIIAIIDSYRLGRSKI